MIKQFTICIALAALAIPGALAQAFTPTDVDNFAAAIEELQALDGTASSTSFDVEMPSAPAGNPMMGGPIDMPELPVDDEGRLAMFRSMLSDTPPGADMSQEIAIIQSHGFSSLDDFAETSDYIMAAYLAFNMGDTGDMNFDPAMMSQIPPQFQAQMAPVIEYMTKMKTIVAAVPQSEIDIVEDKESVLEAAFNG